MNPLLVVVIGVVLGFVTGMWVFVLGMWMLDMRGNR